MIFSQYYSHKLILNLNFKRQRQTSSSEYSSTSETSESGSGSESETDSETRSERTSDESSDELMPPARERKPAHYSYSHTAPSSVYRKPEVKQPPKKKEIPNSVFFDMKGKFLILQSFSVE
jgi:hypothetical protein